MSESLHWKVPEGCCLKLLGDHGSGGGIIKTAVISTPVTVPGWHRETLPAVAPNAAAYQMFLAGHPVDILWDHGRVNTALAEPVAGSVYRLIRYVPPETSQEEVTRWFNTVRFAVLQALYSKKLPLT